LIPSLDNVLPKFKNGPYGPYVWEAGREAKEKGALVSMFGLAPCPWCDCETKEIDDSYIAVCVKNPTHIIE
jgi:hypothetical protein